MNTYLNQLSRLDAIFVPLKTVYIQLQQEITEYRFRNPDLVPITTFNYKEYIGAVVGYVLSETPEFAITTPETNSRQMLISYGIDEMSILRIEHEILLLITSLLGDHIQAISILKYHKLIKMYTWEIDNYWTMSIWLTKA